jgi:AraC-like DNA-binding protein
LLFHEQGTGFGASLFPFRVGYDADVLTSHVLFFAVDIANIVCSALFGARVLAKRPRLSTARLLALITVFSICHFVLSRYEYRYWIPQPFQFDLAGLFNVLNFARNLTPGLFMILCFKMFADSPRFPCWLLGLFLVQAALEALMCWMTKGAQWSPIITRTVPGLLQGLFAGAAIYWTLASWRVDLMEARRHARAIVVAIIGLNIFGSSLLLRVLIPMNTVANYDVHVALVVSNLVILVFILIFLGDGDLEMPLGAVSAAAGEAPAHSPVTSPEITTVLTQLARLMEEERVYKQPSLSVKELADLVGAPEYRLRKIIHEELGYSNFNVFLHQYRIRDACQQLRDPKMQRIPILTIALSTGYQSINTFNRGFREIVDMTPSAYRALSQAPVAPTPRKISPKTA